MHKPLHILVADRNAHIREFLKRELSTESCRVLLAKSACEVIQKMYSDDTLDLLVLDPEIPCANESEFCKKLKNRIPQLPVVLHVSSSKTEPSHDIPYVAVIIEKGEDSIGKLKKWIHDNETFHQPS
jgi:CheY-like chemotaxis protein